MTPFGVILPMLLPKYSVNHRFPSGPAAMPNTQASGVRTRYSVRTPPVVIAPIRLPLSSVNHRRPSGPETMSLGLRWGGSGNSVMLPSGVDRPIWLAVYSVNHSAPSGPVATDVGSLQHEGMRYSVMRSAARASPGIVARKEADSSTTMS